MPKLNVKLIRKVIKHILEEPKRYFQEDIIKTGVPGHQVSYYNHEEQTFAECSTAACIGGWAYLLSHKRPDPNEPKVLEKAAKKLGIEYPQDIILFSGDPGADWPAPFCYAFAQAKTAKGRARAAARLLEAVIKTKGAVLTADGESI